MRLIVERFDRHIQGKLNLLVNDKVDTKVASVVSESLNAMVIKQVNQILHSEEFIEKRRSFISSKSNNTPSYSQFNGVRRPASQKKKRRNQENSAQSRKSALVNSHASSPFSHGGSRFLIQESKGGPEPDIDNNKYFRMEMTPVTVAREKEGSGEGDNTQEPKSSDNLLVSVSTNNLKALNSSSTTN